MNEYPNPKPVTTGESVPAFQSDVSQADAVRGSALTDLQQLHTARTNYAKREQTRLAAKLGADNPEVVRLNAEVEADQHFGNVLGAEVDRANAPAPVVNERGWALYGFVRNQDLQGQPNLTVALFDRANRWIESLGHTCTDGRGYFQLCFVPGKEAAIEPGREVFLRVSDPKQQELYRDTKPMSVTPGESKFREIIVDGDTAVCPPPSAPQKPAPATKSSPTPAKAKKTGTKRAVKNKKV